MNKYERQILSAYERYADAIFRHCYFRLSDRELAADIMQETFIRALKYLAEGKEIQNMRAFLYRTAHNLIVDSFRKKPVVSLNHLQEQGQVFRQKDSGLDARFDSAEAIALFGLLDAKSRDVLIMRYVDELTPKEIAEILGEDKNAVSVRIHRGLRKVREFWSL